MDYRLSSRRLDEGLGGLDKGRRWRAGNEKDRNDCHEPSVKVDLRN